MGPLCQVSVVAAGSVLPQGYASPYSINLIFSDLLLVAAGTERSLRGIDVRIRDAPPLPVHRDELASAKDKKCWLVPKLHL